MRVAMCSLSRVSNGNMIQVSRLKLKRLCKYEFMNLFIHCFDFYIAEYVSVNAGLHLKFHPLHPNITR